VWIPSMYPIMRIHIERGLGRRHVQAITRMAMFPSNNGSINTKFVSLALLLLSVTAALTEANPMGDAKGSSIERNPYRNISTAPSCLRISLYDTDTNRIVNLIIGSTDLADFFTKKRGYSYEDYFNYIEQHRNKPLEISLEQFALSISERFGSKKRGVEYLHSLIFDKPLTLEELRVQSPSELLVHYFDWSQGTDHGIIKSEYAEKYSSDPAFIALLIELGYHVGWGDIAPFLWISQQGNPAAGTKGTGNTTP